MTFQRAYWIYVRIYLFVRGGGGGGGEGGRRMRNEAFIHWMEGVEIRKNTFFFSFFMNGRGIEFMFYVQGRKGKERGMNTITYVDL